MVIVYSKCIRRAEGGNRVQHTYKEGGAEGGNRVQHTYKEGGCGW